MKIVTIVGARPQFIKAATVSRIIRSCNGVIEILIHTGQHYDDKMSAIFFNELEIPHPHFNLEVGSGTHAYQTGMMIQGIENVLLNEKPDWTLVYGDTNSTLAGTLASVKLHIPVAHVEAGLRSFNRIMPEEINRIVTDRISDLLFAPTQTAVYNLTQEGLSNVTRFTGDVMFDSILYYKEKVLQSPENYRLKDIPEQYILATIHRAENTDNPENLKNIFSALSEINFPVILPIHPRTAKIISGTLTIGQNIRLIEPVGYLEMLKLTMDATKIVTDSGGLQKECYFLERPCITIRTETEWIETINGGWNIVVGSDKIKIMDAIVAPHLFSPQTREFGDGHAAEKIVTLLQKR